MTDWHMLARHQVLAATAGSVTIHLVPNLVRSGAYLALEMSGIAAPQGAHNLNYGRFNLMLIMSINV
jgi:hypothetical protein